MAHTIFFSWQSSRGQQECRNLIEQALKMAIISLSNDTTLEMALREGLNLDKDTKDVPGSPPIFSTILAKISEATIFVPDLTSVAKRDNGGGLIPNPNVLIEYGWALRALGHHRMIPVMNTAYGDPEHEPLPFDLAHLRFPIRYFLQEGAKDADRRATRETLAKKIEDALKTVFESTEFKSQLSKPPEPLAFPQQKALDGRARFRESGKPLGILQNQISMAGQTTALQLKKGAACWFRMMPTTDTGQRLLNAELKDLMRELANPPILHMSSNIGFVYGSDGGGYYSYENSDMAYAISYVFKTAEIWMIDSSLGQFPKYLELDERAFSQTFMQCVRFLSERIKLAGPYYWQIGFEGISERVLTMADNFERGAGRALQDVVEDTGVFRLGDDPDEALRPFFEQVFDCFGLRRPNKHRTP